MQLIEKILENNRIWARHNLEENKDYYTSLAAGQKPDILWIGCADSRVPANEVTGTKPGEVFVHRNIANMVIHSDMNMLSVVDYAVNTLHVKHVIVCGHYGCGGVKAAMGRKQNGLVDNWIRHIKDVYRLHEKELEAIKDEEARFDRFVELNVMEQVLDLSKTSIIQNAWSNPDVYNPILHGWVIDLRTGLIKDLGVSMSDNTTLPAIYQIESEIVH